MLSLAALTCATAVAFALVFARTRSLGGRLRAQAHPLHELRGAMTALELGLSLAERDLSLVERIGAAVGERAVCRIVALRPQLERARFAVDELDAQRLGVRDEGVRPPTFDLQKLVLERARTWSALAPAYRASLDSSWSAGEVEIAGDRRRIAEVLDNLISNALEHGGGRVRVEGERAGGEARVTISDRGRGLPRPLSELSHPDWRSIRGHGLAIARSAVRQHGGRLVARNGLSGSSLTVHLPLAGEPAARDGCTPGKGEPVSAARHVEVGSTGAVRRSARRASARAG
jgi:signal transduction histidine kinase